MYLSGAKLKGKSSALNKNDFLRKLVTEEYSRTTADTDITNKITVNKDARKYIYDESSYITGITANSIITLQETHNDDGTISISLLSDGKNEKL